MAKKKDNPAQRTFDSLGSVPSLPADCYSGNRPNLGLRQFVTREAHPYDPTTDEYHVPIFDSQITTTKVNAIYNMHTYWSKKPYEAVRQHIRHYTKHNDL